MIFLKLFFILLGFICGIYFFKKSYKIVHGPNSNIVRKNVYKFKDKYYKFTPVMCIGHKFDFFNLNFA